MGLFRLALAWSVLLGHSGGHGFFGLAFLDRQLAVQCFFIISGFYMALVLNEKYTGPGSYWTFVQQRFLRLYPTYLIILLAILLIDGSVSLVSGTPFGSIQPWSENSHIITPASLAILSEANLLILGQDMVSLLQFDRATGDLSFFNHTGNPVVSAHYFFLNRPSWSLGVELCFYLIAPFLVCRSAKLQILVLLTSVASRWLLSSLLGQQTPWNYVFFPSNLCFFLAGSIGYLFYKRYRARIEAAIPSYQWTFFIFALFVVTYNRLPKAEQLYVIMIPLVCLMVPLLFAATRNNRVDRLIGELSYPFYLIHLHLLWYMHILFANRAQWIYAPACVALTMLLSYLFYRFIETKTEHYRESLYQKSKNKRLVLEKMPLASASPQAAE
jgi:peptidoglycan/LPS O-acetylase OafA/YrhL